LRVAFGDGFELGGWLGCQHFEERRIFHFLCAPTQKSAEIHFADRTDRIEVSAAAVVFNTNALNKVTNRSPHATLQA
jgi:hypothetical protein